MSASGVAKIFKHGRSQAVRLPKEFRMPGDRVRVTRVAGGGVLLEPMELDLDAMWAKIDAISDKPFLEDFDREQPPMPPDDDIDDFD